MGSRETLSIDLQVRQSCNVLSQEMGFCQWSSDRHENELFCHCNKTIPWIQVDPRWLILDHWALSCRCDVQQSHRRCQRQRSGHGLQSSRWLSETQVCSSCWNTFISLVGGSLREPPNPAGCCRNVMLYIPSLVMALEKTIFG